MQRTKDALRNVPLFSDLSSNEIDILSNVALIRNYAKNEVIIQRQEEGDTFFAIMAGRVKIVLNDEDGKEFIIGMMQENEFFGELSLIDGGPRSASVIAIEPTEVVVLRREDFLNQITGHPEIAIKVMKELSTRLRNSNESIESLVFLDVCGRLARILLDSALENGRETPDGIEIMLVQKRVELASLVGTTRETLTRALKTLETMGYIKIRKKAIIVTNRHGLKSRVY